MALSRRAWLGPRRGASLALSQAPFQRRVAVTAAPALNTRMRSSGLRVANPRYLAAASSRPLVFAGLGYAGYRRARQLPPIQSGHQAMYDVQSRSKVPSSIRQWSRRRCKAKEKGAVWDGAAWSIFDRAITIDPAVMVTTTPAVTSPV